MPFFVPFPETPFVRGACSLGGIAIAWVGGFLLMEYDHTGFLWFLEALLLVVGIILAMVGIFMDALTESLSELGVPGILASIIVTWIALCLVAYPLVRLMGLLEPWGATSLLERWGLIKPPPPVRPKEKPFRRLRSFLSNKFRRG